MESHRRFSNLWKNITKPLLTMDEFSNTFHNGIGLEVGDGSKIAFWSQEWIQGCILKYEFPRIYALAAFKDGKVNEFGKFENGEWKWNIVLRRSPFDWEKGQWNAFWEKINNHYVCSDGVDRLIWKSNPSGNYSAKSFYKDHFNVGAFLKSGWRKVWLGFVPPKVETFCWQLLKGRIAVKNNLVARKLLHEYENRCSFCDKEEEFVNHLFFSCPVSWSIWAYWINLWGIQGPLNKDAWSCFVEWQHLIPFKCYEKIWSMIFCCIIWSIWLFRNEIVFMGKKLDCCQLVDLIKCRLTHWVKALWPNMQLPFLDLGLSPSYLAISVKKLNPRPIINWIEPKLGEVKFNVDGASLGKPGPAGIGGSLKDHQARELIRFSKSIGLADSNTAELLAIKEALILFVNSFWLHDRRLIIESDSRNAVHWALHPQLVPWRMRNVSNHIENLKKQIPSWNIVHVYRESNQVADRLAKDGINRSSDLLVLISE